MVMGFRKPLYEGKAHYTCVFFFFPYLLFREDKNVVTLRFYNRLGNSVLPSPSHLDLSPKAI